MALQLALIPQELASSELGRLELPELTARLDYSPEFAQQRPARLEARPGLLPDQLLVQMALVVVARCRLDLASEVDLQIQPVLHPLVERLGLEPERRLVLG